MKIGEEPVGGVPGQGLQSGVIDDAGRGGSLVRITRRGSTVVVEVGGNQVAAGLAALSHLLADLIDDQGNLFVAVELCDGGVIDPVLLAALGQAQARSPRCQLTVVAGTSRERCPLLSHAVGRRVTLLISASPARRAASQWRRCGAVRGLQRFPAALSAWPCGPVPQWHRGAEPGSRRRTALTLLGS